MNRRAFVLALVGAAAWPLAARAQPGQRLRRIGALMLISEADPRAESYVASFRQRLQELGWVDGRNVLIDIRWGAGESANFRRHAADLAALAPDVVLAAGAPPVIALKELSSTMPIVFVAVVDPVGSGIAASLARPRGNATGFMNFEFSIAAKWLELLKEIAPAVRHVAVLRDPTNPTGIGQFAAIQTVAPMGLELSVIGLQRSDEIERAVEDFARVALASGASGQRGNSIVRAPDTRPEPGSSARVSKGGLIVTASQFGATYPDLIARLAARHKLPVVYPFRYFVTSGGLISYGPDFVGQFRQAAGYVDRILKGEKPADLPVQAPTRYELVINLKTAKALGLEVPATLLARADEVIE
jgi:putative ABC transport system substrate-binding protein